MTTDDLRTRAREAAEERYAKVDQAQFRLAFVHGYLAHAAQQPSVDAIRQVITDHEMQQCGFSGDGVRDRWYQCRGCGHETERRRDWVPEEAEEHWATEIHALLNGAKS